jgi:hypothetical protein
MSILEEEIVQRYEQLSLEQRLHLLDRVDIQWGVARAEFDYAAWTKQADLILAAIRAEHGADYVTGTQDLLDELREETSWPRRSS